MDADEKRFVKFFVLVFLGAVIAVGALAVTVSYFEAQSYNRLTGAHVTTWDAMWLDLRVMERPK